MAPHTGHLLIAAGLASSTCQMTSGNNTSSRRRNPTSETSQVPLRRLDWGPFLCEVSRKFPSAVVRRQCSPCQMNKVSQKEADKQEGRPGFVRRARKPKGRGDSEEQLHGPDGTAPEAFHLGRLQPAFHPSAVSHEEHRIVGVNDVAFVDACDDRAWPGLPDGPGFSLVHGRQAALYGRKTPAVAEAVSFWGVATVESNGGVHLVDVLVLALDANRLGEGLIHGDVSVYLDFPEIDRSVASFPGHAQVYHFFRRVPKNGGRYSVRGQGIV